MPSNSRLRDESEGTRESDYPKDARLSRPNRAKVNPITLGEDEQAWVQQAAYAQHLPPSTQVRSWILEGLNHDKTA